MVMILNFSCDKNFFKCFSLFLVIKIYLNSVEHCTLHIDGAYSSLVYLNYMIVIEYSFECLTLLIAGI